MPRTKSAASTSSAEASRKSVSKRIARLLRSIKLM